jgi:hypothetical protein
MLLLISKDVVEQFDLNELDGTGRSPIVGPSLSARKLSNLLDICGAWRVSGLSGDASLGRRGCSFSIPYLCSPHGTFQPNVPGNDKRTALHWSAYQSQPKFVKVLLSYGANAGLQDADGRYVCHSMSPPGLTAAARRCILHLAPAAQRFVAVGSSGACDLLQCMKLLVQDVEAAVVDQVDAEGMTAAHWCAFHNHWKHLDCLVSVVCWSSVL